MKITPGKWFFVTVTFSQKSGLKMFEDEKMVSDDPNGTPGGDYPIDEMQPNLCVGRNVGNVGIVFSRFYMSSLVTFKEELSSEMVQKVFFFFSRQGELQWSAFTLSSVKNKHSKTVSRIVTDPATKFQSVINRILRVNIQTTKSNHLTE